MAGYVNTIKDFKTKENPEFLAKVKELQPILHHKNLSPVNRIELKKTEDNSWLIHGRKGYMPEKKLVLQKDTPLCLEFPNHQVGYIRFFLDVVGSPLDAPVHLRIKLGEIVEELGEDTKDYHGWLSSSWLQEEYLHVDVVPGWVELPRRYAFRYLSLEILNQSLKYQIGITNITGKTVTSAEEEAVEELPADADPFIKEMDAAAVRTLRDCMQLVFEDGPKRDRRLWIGDLRLQALVNYYTFRNMELVKRCIYMFAGITGADGRVGACFYIEPKLQVDDTVLFDYSLFFISCLYDYYEVTKDKEFIAELWPTALRQIELSKERLGFGGILKDSGDWWCFLDWGDNLNKQAGAQGVFIYTVKQAIGLAKIVEDEKALEMLEELCRQLTSSALSRLWDGQQQVFVSGEMRQVSVVSQVWMLLAGILEDGAANKLIDRLLAGEIQLPLSTPYMYHYFVEALFQYGRREEAVKVMKEYWGGMLEKGADTFWELYNPADDDFSPYGSKVINSYCHAWSCTPSYFIRKYHLK
ncbi:MAG TPA: sugar hydrolase [Clostridiales bacterium]|nr:sugar hydrolase [Clostridiales bacterium]